MVHRSESRIARLIYEGKHWGNDGAYAEAVRQYRRSEKKVEERIEFASSMFSVFIPLYPMIWPLKQAARHPAEAVRAVRSGVLRLWPQMRSLRHVPPERFNDADQAETLSSVFVRWTLVPVIGGKGYLKPAEALAERAYDLSYAKPGGHTQALALITLARIALARGDLLHADDLVGDALYLAPRIIVANQKARVYSGAAELLDAMGNLDRAMDTLRRADEVQGVDAVTTDKLAQMRNQLGYEKL